MQLCPPSIPGRLAAWLVVAVLWACIFLAGLGSLELQGNEAKRILPAIHMLESGNWLLPELGGVTYVNKPPLVYWSVAASFRLAGSRSEWAARMPSVLSILLFVSLLVLMPSSLLGLSARLVSAIVFMTTVSFIEKGRQIEIEAAFVSVTGMAVVWWLNAWAGCRGRWSIWFVPCLILGIGLLLKGPLILLFFYAVVLISLLYLRRLKDAVNVPHLLGIAAMVAMSAWWWLYVLLAHPAAHTILTDEVGARFLPKQIDYCTWIGTWFKVPFVDLLPWAVFLPLVWTRSWVARIPAAQQPVFKACRLALVLCFVLVNAMPGTRDRYSMPLFPLAALLMGWLLSVQTARPRLERTWRAIVLVFFPVCVVAAVTASLLVPTGYVFPLIERFNGPSLAAQPTAGSYIGAACVFIVAGVATAAAYRLRHHLYGMENLSIATGAGIALLVLGFAAYALPILNLIESRRPVGIKLTNAVPPGQQIYLSQFLYEPFLYYINRPIVTLDTNDVPPEARFVLVPDGKTPLLFAQPAFASRAPCAKIQIAYKGTAYSLYEVAR